MNAAVDEIWASTRAGEGPPASWVGKLSTVEAYEVQLAVLDRQLESGLAQGGWKVGLTSAAIRQELGVTEPVFGYLLAANEWADGVVLELDELLSPAFENELCLTIGQSLTGPDVSAEDALTAISLVAPAFEIVERRANAKADLNLTIADNAQQRAYVVGTPIRLPEGLDLSAVQLEVRTGGEVRASATGTEVLGHPAASVAWLANALSQFGRSLEPGMRVMSGSFTPQYTLERGDVIEAAFDPIGTVRASCR